MVCVCACGAKERRCGDQRQDTSPIGADSPSPQCHLCSGSGRCPSKLHILAQRQGLCRLRRGIAMIQPSLGQEELNRRVNSDGNSSSKQVQLHIFGRCLWYFCLWFLFLLYKKQICRFTPTKKLAVIFHKKQKKLVVIVVLHKRQVYRGMMQISKISAGMPGMCMKYLLTKLFIALRLFFAQFVVSCNKFIWQLILLRRRW